MPGTENRATEWKNYRSRSFDYHIITVERASHDWSRLLFTARRNRLRRFIVQLWNTRSDRDFHSIGDFYEFSTCEPIRHSQYACIYAVAAIEIALLQKYLYSWRRSHANNDNLCYLNVPPFLNESSLQSYTMVQFHLVTTEYRVTHKSMSTIYVVTLHMKTSKKHFYEFISKFIFYIS